MAVGFLLLAHACGGNPAGSGTAGASGGATATGGASASGGTTSNGGGTGGATAAGGATSTGDSKTTGGATGMGGGTSTGGTTGSGGASTTGGATASGGASATGGATGGTRATGGNVGSGGGAGAGGSQRIDGGLTATGGAAATGGVTAAGGNKATGGATGTAGASGTGGAAGTGGATHPGKWQIMPLGDSITGTTCYPKLLSKELIDKGHTNFDFVGTVLNNQGCGSGVANVQTEGHGGYLVTYLTSDAQASQNKGSLTELKTWAAEKPDVVLMEYGTNDVWSNIAPDTITTAFSFVVDQFRSQNPGVIFFVAQITPMNPSGCADCETRVEAFNKQIPTWATGKTTPASPIYVADVWSALKPAAGYTPNSTNTSDGVHPNAAGSQLMADAWYAGLAAQGIP